MPTVPAAHVLELHNICGSAARVDAAAVKDHILARDHIPYYHNLRFTHKTPSKLSNRLQKCTNQKLSSLLIHDYEGSIPFFVAGRSKLLLSVATGLNSIVGSYEPCNQS